MQQIICPVDGQPCEAACPDRYRDREEGGCLLADLAAHADTVMILQEGGGDNGR